MKPALTAILLAACALAASPLEAAAPSGDFRAAAGEAYRSGRYDAGIRALRAELSRMPAAATPARGEALYLLGRLELRKGELELELARAARRHAADHLARVAAGPTPLKRAPYYLGLARLEEGDREGATSAFRQALRMIPARAKGEDRVTRQLAELRLRALQGRVPALAAAAALRGEPRVAAEAAFLMATDGREPARGLAAAEAALVEPARTGSPPASVVRAAAGARLANGKLDEALSLLEGEQAHSPASIERVGTNHSVEYYDVLALRLLAEANLRSAARHLEGALEGAGQGQALLREAAAFSAARAWLRLGDAKAALDHLKALAAPSTLGPAGVARVKALSARARGLIGSRAEAARLWQEAIADAGSDPDAVGEIADLLGDAHAGGEVDAKVVRAALARASAVADGWTRRLPQTLAGGLGSLTLAAGGDAAAAVAQFERGRDKSAKNRLDANDPVFLARLAQAQVRARLFSEALEIYFEMSKSYPEVRQVQEALQGVYAAEQVAAGEVRIN